MIVRNGVVEVVNEELDANHLVVRPSTTPRDSDHSVSHIHPLLASAHRLAQGLP